MRNASETSLSVGLQSTESRDDIAELISGGEKKVRKKLYEYIDKSRNASLFGKDGSLPSYVAI